MTHSGIGGMYTKEMGQYEVFMGHNFPEAFRRVNASLDIVKRHMAGEIRNHNHDNGIFWSFWPYPVRGDARPTSIFSSNRVIEIGYPSN